MHPASLLSFFTIGIGPSSSHTVGPMKAAYEFLQTVAENPQVAHLRCELFGSLAATGKGHHTDQALILGFLGFLPETVPIDRISYLLDQVSCDKTVALPNGRAVRHYPKEDLVFHRRRSLPLHPNGMHFQALSVTGELLAEEVVYSLGGGFIATEAELKNPSENSAMDLPHPYRSAKELLALCQEHQISIADLVIQNEAAIRPEAETRAYLAKIWATMQDCVERGCQVTGTLPGGLQVTRRAPRLFEKLTLEAETNDDPLQLLDWVNLYALAVNEENAAGGRIVTAPTNGAAGIIPAVLHYAMNFKKSPHEHPCDVFLLTAGAIANLYKQNASLSGADVGCQGEVGVACSMAAAALTAYLGGTPEQVAQAAEIGMEHNLGLTCDPIGGLVQIPCIERNAMGSVKAINAARLAMSSDGNSRVSLDKVIATMLQTGRDMQAKYKETSRGGLAVNFTEC